jgi:hypothetical protein
MQHAEWSTIQPSLFKGLQQGLEELIVDQTIYAYVTMESLASLQRQSCSPYVQSTVAADN